VFSWQQLQYRGPEGVVVGGTQPLVLDPKLGALGLAQQVQGEAPNDGQIFRRMPHSGS